MKNKLLIIEDDLGLQKQLKWALSEAFNVIVVGNRRDALKMLGKHAPAVVTLDLGLPPDADGVSEGFATLNEIREQAPHTKIVMLTSNDDKENALKAINLGAYDYCQKPFDEESLELIIRRAINLYNLEEENRRLSCSAHPTSLEGIAATSPQMIAICRTVERVAPADVATLVLGESGTGKELIARSLHDLSPRKNKPFVAINCAAIPENLLESELFGYEKGAFTGATQQTKGKIEYADGGTLFLDEIGDLPMSLQAKLLRFLQERVVERLGGRAAIEVDIRVVCATHQDVSMLIKEEKFREDLYYRIAEITIEIPPLRVREGDAVLLAHTFLNKYSKLRAKKISGFTVDALSAIEAYHWPGNVRELENKLKRAIILADDGWISAEALDLSLPLDGGGVELDLRKIRDSAERQAIQRALGACNGNVSRAAELLGVSRPTLYSLMSKFNLK